MGKLVDGESSEYATEQVRAGADAIQVFDSWVGCLSVGRLPALTCCPHAAELVGGLQRTGVPIIYFGTDTRSAV